MGYFDIDGQPTEWDSLPESFERRESRLITEGHPLYVSPAGEPREKPVPCRGRCMRPTFAYRAVCIDCTEELDHG